MPKNLLSYPSSKKAFTLVEILVVIGIIVILSALVVTALNPAQLRRAARDTNRQKDAAIISAALEQYYADNNIYPNANNNMRCLAGILDATDINCTTSGNQAGPTVYIKTVPLTQSNVSVEYCYSRPDSQNYIICVPTEANTSEVINGGNTIPACTPTSPIAGGVYGDTYGAYCITNPF